jgi:hypothetical protein
MPTPGGSPLSAESTRTGRKRDKLARSIVGWKYITPEGRVNVLQYKYRGADHSYIYKYIGSPLAEFFVKLTPTWVAYVGCRDILAFIIVVSVCFVPAGRIWWVGYLWNFEPKC